MTISMTNCRKTIYNGITFVFLFTVLAGFTSCSENDEDPITTTEISSEDAADIVELALAPSSNGISRAMDEAARISVVPIPCGETVDTSFTINVDRNNLTADYTTNYDWSLKCIGIVPNEFIFNRSTSGQYETLRMVSNDQGSSNWAIDYEIGANEMIGNGTYTRSGSQESKVRNQNKFESTTQIEVSSIVVDINSREITGGTGTFTIIGTANPGTEDSQSMEYTGQIIFQGNGKALIEINDQTYLIDLN